MGNILLDPVATDGYRGICNETRRIRRHITLLFRICVEFIASLLTERDETAL